LQQWGEDPAPFWTSVYQMPKGAFLFLYDAAHWIGCKEYQYWDPKRKEQGGLLMETSLLKKYTHRKRGEEL